MTPSQLQTILEHATVPEHSVAFMKAMSGGEPFVVGPHLFLSAQDWLVAVGYPLLDAYDPKRFAQAITDALIKTRATYCWAISACLPEGLKSHCRQQDHYYVLPSDTTVPGRLQRLAERAADCLRMEEGSRFTPAHRRLWAEFTARTPLPTNVRELFARTEHVLAHAPGIILLNAWDRADRLAACLVLDTAPRCFLSYLIGAYSRIHYTPHASDFLFLEMIRIARRQGKKSLHLGLGVNAGIRRFKTKWGGAPVLPYEMAAWREKEGVGAGMNALVRMLAAMPAGTLSKQQYMDSLPRQRRFAMLWEIREHDHRSFIGGTAHFFCYSFENSFRKLFDHVDTVLFEGPLDPASLDQVSDIGRSPEPGAPRLIDALDEKDIRQLERVVCGPKGRWAKILGFDFSQAPDVRFLLSSTRPWMAFFSIWSGYLSRCGWCQSVDLEAWHLARETGKAVRGMETIAEQIDTLESIPLSRIVHFFRQCRQWKTYIRQNMRAYLKGDLDGMMGTSTEFPTRTQGVIHRRDQRFLERMHPFLDQGRCAVFVGSAHMINLRGMLVRSGYTLRRSK